MYARTFSVTTRDGLPLAKRLVVATGKARQDIAEKETALLATLRADYPDAYIFTSTADEKEPE